MVMKLCCESRRRFLTTISRTLALVFAPSSSAAHHPSIFEVLHMLIKHRRQSQRDVSPIDEMSESSRSGLGTSSRNPSSGIPVYRGEKHRKSVASTAASFVSRKEVGDGPRGRVSHDPRWDPYSGEITTSDRGKPQSTKPGSFVPPSLNYKDSGRVMGNQKGVAPGASQNASFGDRIRKMKNNSSTAAPVERPGWKGATGRVAIVSPVADQPDMPPISIPRKSSKRVASPHSTSFSGASSPVTIVRNGDDETDSASPDPSIQAILINSGQASPRNAIPITIHPDPVEVNVSAAAQTLARDNAPAWEREDGTMANIERNFREQLKTINPPDHYEQPASRFSVTTYAPSEAQSTPRPSTDTWDRPAMPTPPQMHSATASPLPNRKRPQFTDSPKVASVVTRKAIHPSSPVFISMSTAHSTRNSSITTKTLPMTPSEASSHDLVTSLQAQLDDLAHRKNNIARSIRQMTELMPKDSVMMKEDVRRKREMEKIKVEQLRAEEADVKREEHDIGLKLYRALKRKDKDAVFEPTGLWVRRVTG